jgi:PPK2 family polyphosphate:nucleotide phosphotransferase
MKYAIPVSSSKPLHLDKLDAKQDGGLTKAEGEQQFAALGAELRELQELLYAAGQHSLLIVLQGRDTSGKDGTIRAVFDYVNAAGCRVESFKVPTAEELAHDFLWRCHKATPARGMLTVFNRSHYEDVLVVRVHNLTPEERWRKRYAHINHWEELLADNDTIILKFMLHISRDEQEERLLAREKDPTKAWKLSVGDWKERQFWDDYASAYEDALSQCNTPHAPWFVVPADRKWFRNLAIADTIVRTLRPYRDGWLAKLDEMGKEERAALMEYRSEGVEGKG